MLVLYIFIPAAALVFLLMAIASIPKKAISAGQTIIADHIILYRIVVVALAAAGCYASEILRLAIYGWLLLSVAGVIMFVVDRDSFNSAALLRFVFPFKALLYVWRGFR
ncbi:hypothetical protein ACDY96_17620 [Rhizobium mongolense]|uniref:hypothetical protein n=1 Tax=Rhizobium mongolense TaxID=57676 RepID=UPI00355719FC